MSFFLPGLILALVFQLYYIVGLLTVLMLPLTLIVNSLMYVKQKAIFAKYGLKVRRNIIGLIGHAFLYQIISAPASLAGYAAEFFKRKRTW